jgi:hypothetical protein
MVLEAGMSVLSRRTSMPSHSSAGRDLAGRFVRRPMASAISRTGRAWSLRTDTVRQSPWQ